MSFLLIGCFFRLRFIFGRGFKDGRRRDDEKCIFFFLGKFGRKYFILYSFFFILWMVNCSVLYFEVCVIRCIFFRVRRFKDNSEEINVLCYTIFCCILM